MATIKKLGTRIKKAQIIQYRDTNNKKIRSNIKDYVTKAIELFKNDINGADAGEPMLADKAINYFSVNG